jgi:hypothetical protein
LSHPNVWFGFIFHCAHKTKTKVGKQNQQTEDEREHQNNPRLAGKPHWPFVLWLAGQTPRAEPERPHSFSTPVEREEWEVTRWGTEPKPQLFAQTSLQEAGISLSTILMWSSNDAFVGVGKRKHTRSYLKKGRDAARREIETRDEWKKGAGSAVDVRESGLDHSFHFISFPFPSFPEMSEGGGGDRESQLETGDWKLGGVIL